MKSKVYFSKTISPEKIIELIELSGKKLPGSIAVKVYFEKPDAKDCFHSAVCYLPDYKWEDINGFTPAEIARYQELVESTAHLILQFSKEGGVENAAGFYRKARN